jgi:transketolase
MGLPADETFWVPDDVLAMYREAGARGKAGHDAWRQRHDEAGDVATAWDADWSGEGLDKVSDLLPAFDAGASMATRKASQQCVTALADAVPALMGGSADLTGNTGTKIDDVAHTASSPAGRQLFFGVREHAMAAAVVGAARHGGVIPFCGTFLVFADYMRPSVRLAAMSQAKCVFVWTHDSVGVGEDGPTHQPVEQVMSLRSIPGLRVIRPADATEVAGAWSLALTSDGPSALIFTRQDVPVLASTRREGVALGAYALDPVDQPDVTLIGTGSEVSLCVEAAARLADDGVTARVVSMPCWETFEGQSADARAAVIDPGIPAVSVEAGVTLGWARWADTTIGIDTFGASAPAARVLREYGITADHVVAAATRLLDDHD